MVDVAVSAVLVCALRTTNKKGHQLFEEKSAPLPPEKILAAPMCVTSVIAQVRQGPHLRPWSI